VCLTGQACCWRKMKRQQAGRDKPAWHYCHVKLSQLRPAVTYSFFGSQPLMFLTAWCALPYARYLSMPFV